MVATYQRKVFSYKNNVHCSLCIFIQICNVIPLTFFTSPFYVDFFIVTILTYPLIHGKVLLKNANKHIECDIGKFVVQSKYNVYTLTCFLKC